MTVDMGTPSRTGPGPDVRVYQTVRARRAGDRSTPPPARTGPFTLVGLRVPCGARSAAASSSNHCDFDLAAGEVTAARYFKVEDGEIYPVPGRQARPARARTSTPSRS